MPVGLSREQECQWVPTGPRTGAGDFQDPASQTHRRRRFPAGAARRRDLRVGRGTSEWEALPARLAVHGSSLVQTGSLTAVPGWGEWARICNYFNLLELGGSSQNSGDKEEGRTFRTEYICRLSWTWLTLNSVCDLEQIT